MAIGGAAACSAAAPTGDCKIGDASPTGEGDANGCASAILLGSVSGLSIHHAVPTTIRQIKVAIAATTKKGFGAV